MTNGLQVLNQANNMSIREAQGHKSLIQQDQVLLVASRFAVSRCDLLCNPRMRLKASKMLIGDVRTKRYPIVGQQVLVVTVGCTSKVER